MNAYIDSSEVLTNTKQILRLTNADNDTWLESLILNLSRNLSTVETLIIKDCTVTVENNRFYLPKDCKKLIAFRTKNSCIQGIIIDVPFFKHCGCNVQNWGSLINYLDINGRWANFINTIDDGTEIEIAYQRIDVDEDGMPKINEEAYTALSFGAAYQFALSYPELYTPEQRREWKTLWQYQAARCRGLAGRRVFEQQKAQIQRAMNTMVNQAAPMSLLAGQYTAFFYPTIWSLGGNL